MVISFKLVVTDFSRQNSWRLLFYVAGGLFTIPFNICIENLAVLLGMFGDKYKFYVVNKDIERDSRGPSPSQTPLLDV